MTDQAALLREETESIELADSDGPILRAEQ